MVSSSVLCELGLASIDILERSDDIISVRFIGFPRQYLNALRRIAISELPIMAIDDVIIHYNSSVMHDEALAHRLGLIPLRTELNRFVKAEECSCKSTLGCPNCRVLFYIDVEAIGKPREVLSGDLVSEDDYVKPINPNIPIVILASGQKLKVEAYAKLGVGKSHAKWQPVSIAVLKEDNNDFILRLESIGSLSATQILFESIKILSEKLRLFESNLKIREGEYAKSSIN